ncbi:epithelial membrane protein 3 isoform 1-T3 [Dugong dugon]
MSVLLLVVSALHILILILLFVATLDKSWWTLPGKESLNLWYDCTRNSSTEAWTCSNVSENALYHAARRALLCHWLLPALHQCGSIHWSPDLCHPLQGDSEASPAWGQLRLLLCPGLGGLPPCPGQRHHLHPPAEAGVSTLRCLLPALSLHPEAPAPECPTENKTI